jgi:hypothetical protein
VGSLPVVVFPPPFWSNQDIVLYHGTVDAFVLPLTSGGVLSSTGKPGTDFGPGFYTTTVLTQAQMWAFQLSASRSGTTPAVVEFTVGREALANLETLAFVRGDFQADNFWSLVHYCRKGATDHSRTPPRSYYDVVYGPVAAFWNQRMLISGADQISFHTPAADAVLNLRPGRRIM